MRSAYLFESQNLAKQTSEKVTIEAKTTANESGRTQKLIDATSSYKTYLDFGTLRLANTTPIVPVITVPKPGQVFINDVRFISDEYLEISEELITNAIMENVGEKDLKDVSVAVMVPDMGVFRTVGPFDLDADDRQSKNIYIELPQDAAPGEYGVRIEISNDDIHRTVWRTFVVQK